jgi:hypothetical protein
MPVWDLVPFAIFHDVYSSCKVTHCKELPADSNPWYSFGEITQFLLQILNEVEVSGSLVSIIFSVFFNYLANKN